MAQQPNIDLHASSAQQPTAGTGPERPWAPNRPGELTGTGMPWGGAFGTPGPDAGYALKLVAGRELVLADHEHRADANAAVAAVGAARSSLIGRGPIKEDIDVRNKVKSDLVRQGALLDFFFLDKLPGFIFQRKDGFLSRT